MARKLDLFLPFRLSRVTFDTLQNVDVNFWPVFLDVFAPHWVCFLSDSFSSLVRLASLLVIRAPSEVSWNDLLSSFDLIQHIFHLTWDDWLKTINLCPFPFSFVSWLEMFYFRHWIMPTSSRCTNRAAHDVFRRLYLPVFLVVVCRFSLFSFDFCPAVCLLPCIGSLSYTFTPLSNDVHTVFSPVLRYFGHEYREISILLLSNFTLGIILQFDCGHFVLCKFLY